MRCWLIFALFLCTAVNSLSQVAADEETNFRCVERIEVPRYPSVALSANLAGTVAASVHLTASGAVQDLSTDMETKNGAKPKILTLPVEAAIHTSTFRRDCGGKIIRLIFIFEMKEQPSVAPKQVVTFESPNKFRITSEPQKAIVD